MSAPEVPCLHPLKHMNGMGNRKREDEAVARTIHPLGRERARGYCASWVSAGATCLRATPKHRLASKTELVNDFLAQDRPGTKAVVKLIRDLD